MQALERGRASYAAHAWLDAYDLLLGATQQEPVAPADLELLARSAYMLGLDDDYAGALERAHHAYVAVGDVPHAVRCTVWIGHSFMFRGDATRGSGWFARGQRLLDGHDTDCVEEGYLLIPLWLQQIGAGEPEAGRATADESRADRRAVR